MSTGRVVVQSGATRALAFPVSAVCSLVTAHVVIANFGAESYAYYSLLVSVALVLPVLDFGVGAAVTNAASAEFADPQGMRRILVSSLRVLLVISVAVGGASALLAIFHLWPHLLGIASIEQTNEVSGLSLVLFAVALPLSLGQRLLIGLGQNHWAIAIQAMQPPLTLLGVAIIAQLGVPGRYTVLAFLGAVAIGALLCSWRGLRSIGDSFVALARDSLHPKRVPGVRIGGTSWPMFLQIAVNALALQTDRLVLSHFGTSQNVVAYSLSGQVFSAALSVVTASGLALWQPFRCAWVKGQPVPVFRYSAMLSLFGAAACFLLYLLAPRIFSAVAGSATQVDSLTLIGWCLVVVSYAFLYPLGMYLTDEAGLKFQVPFLLVGIPANVVLSAALTPSLGAAGPLLATSAMIVLLQIVPNSSFAQRRLRLTRRMVRVEASNGEHSGMPNA